MEQAPRPGVSPETTPPLELGRYRHYKGGEYEVVQVARNSETLEEVAIYYPVENTEEIWVRPVRMFHEYVSIDGRAYPRFRLID